MATLTIEPVAWRYLGPKGGWITVETKPSAYYAALPLFTSEALAQARAEGKSEGMRDGVETPTHRHKKRGSEYVLIGYGKMQAERWHQRVGEKANTTVDQMPTVDMREVAIYRSATDPTEIWVRPREEFEDGRFEALLPPANGEGR